ncbi:zinc-binding dehydrogenase [Dorea sp. D27]|uniref:zinc-binding dehydrogenase n=1 Tax=Dorea sp. D27 TaxID=658665 RepID=UPI0006732017|nr:zinc-binding dehydrogenase [Dorea sp. D27]KMZ55155.1 putative L-iditol 2-dehydrogenase [Dorea sp. D27]
MKKVMFYDPKDIRIEECPVPKPGYGEIVVRNKVALTCGTDVKTYMRGYPGDIPPYGFGHEASGVVYAVGEGVAGISVGDRIVCHNSAPCQTCFYCKKGIHSMCDDMLYNMGAFSQYQLIPKRIVDQNSFILPDTMSHETAALMEPLSCVVFGAERVGVQLGDTVVVNGAGPIGLMYIALLVKKGAQVIATDLSETRLKSAKKLGAFATVNASNGEAAAKVKSLTPGGRGCDIAIEATGYPEVWEQNILMARKGGTVLLFGGTKAGTQLIADANLVHYSQLTIMGLYHTAPRYTMAAFELLKSSAVKAEDFISGSYALDEIETAILEHAKGTCIKNKILFDV